MAQLTYPRGLRLKSETKATDEAANPWLDDQTTARYRAALPLPEHAQSARLAEAPTPQPSAAASLESAQRTATLEQRANVSLESFWSEQTQVRRTQIMARAFDPRWMRVLAAGIGIALCVLFGWVLVAGSELPSIAPKTRTLVPANTATMELNAPEAQSSDSATAPNALAPSALASRAAAAHSGSAMTRREPSASPAASTRAVQSASAVASSRAMQDAGAAAHARAMQNARAAGGTPTVPSTAAAASGSARSRRSKAPAGERRANAQQLQQLSSGRPATLHIDSRPGSEVFIDNRSLGPTPQRSISLQPGVHHVRLHNRQLNVLKILTLHVLPGESIERMELLDP